MKVSGTKVIKFFPLKDRIVLAIGLFLKFLLNKLPNHTLLNKNKNSLKKIASFTSMLPRVVNKNFQFTYFNQEINLRRKGSDMFVFEQIFINKEYEPVVKLIQEQSIKIKTILDLGANIGLTSIYFNHFFKDAEIYCLEPDFTNFEILNLNTKNIHNIHSFQKGIWNKNEKLAIHNNFRDQLEWSKKTISSLENNSIEGITLHDFMKEIGVDQIDLLKIDIEGSEDQLFNHYSEINKILEKVKVLVIEIHNEICDPELITKRLLENDFTFFKEGELVIASKKNA